MSKENPNWQLKNEFYLCEMVFIQQMKATKNQDWHLHLVTNEIPTKS